MFRAFCRRASRKGVKQMWLSKEEWRALLVSMSENRKLMGPIERIVKDEKVNVIKYGCGCGEPQRVEVLLSLSSREWSEIEKSDAWERLKRIFEG